jgi:hypothetical protein
MRIRLHCILYVDVQVQVGQVYIHSHLFFYSLTGAFFIQLDTYVCVDVDVDVDVDGARKRTLTCS